MASISTAARVNRVDRTSCSFGVIEPVLLLLNSRLCYIHIYALETKE